MRFPRALRLPVLFILGGAVLLAVVWIADMRTTQLLTGQQWRQDCGPTETPCSSDSDCSGYQNAWCNSAGYCEMGACAGGACWGDFRTATCLSDEDCVAVCEPASGRCSMWSSGGDVGACECNTCQTGEGCGDGVVDNCEQCDDGNTDSLDGCSDCRVEDCYYYENGDYVCPYNGVCGDGMMNDFLSEECDDGNTQNGDGCDADCSVESAWDCGPWCGDQLSECTQEGRGSSSCSSHDDCPEGQYCGNDIDGGPIRCLSPWHGETVCRPPQPYQFSQDCHSQGFTCPQGQQQHCVSDAVSGGHCECYGGSASCGNGVVDEGEICDVFSIGCTLDDTEGTCSDDCSRCVICGDGILDAGEACESDSDCSPGQTCSGCFCERTEQTASCGNGVVEAGEECDDENGENGDGCDEFCQIEQVVEPVEATCGSDGDCPDGGICRDGRCMRCYKSWWCSVLNWLGSCPEVCVEVFPDDDVSPLQQGFTPVCGNDVIEEGEECDDGNTLDGDACASDCTAVDPHCGDGIVRDDILDPFDPLFEFCDDGDVIGEDGLHNCDVCEESRCNTQCRFNACWRDPAGGPGYEEALRSRLEHVGRLLQERALPLPSVPQAAGSLRAQATQQEQEDWLNSIYRWLLVPCNSVTCCKETADRMTCSTAESCAPGDTRYVGPTVDAALARCAGECAREKYICDYRTGDVFPITVSTTQLLPPEYAHWRYRVFPNRDELGRDMSAVAHEQCERRILCCDMTGPTDQCRYYVAGAGQRCGDLGATLMLQHPYDTNHPELGPSGVATFGYQQCNIECAEARATMRTQQMYRCTTPGAACVLEGGPVTDPATMVEIAAPYGAVEQQAAKNACDAACAVMQATCCRKATLTAKPSCDTVRPEICRTSAFMGPAYFEMLNGISPQEQCADTCTRIAGYVPVGQTGDCRPVYAYEAQPPGTHPTEAACRAAAAGTQRYICCDNADVDTLPVCANLAVPAADGVCVAFDPSDSLAQWRAENDCSRNCKPSGIGARCDPLGARCPTCTEGTNGCPGTFPLMCWTAGDDAAAPRCRPVGVLDEGMPCTATYQCRAGQRLVCSKAGLCQKY